MLADYGSSLYFIKTHFKGSLTSMKMHNNAGEGRTSTYGYAANINLATSFHNDDKNSFYHTFGFGYEGSFMKGFRMSATPNILYKGDPNHLVFAQVGAKWKRLLKEKLRLSMEAGAKYHFLRTMKTRLKIKGSPISSDSFEIPAIYGYAGSSLAIEVKPNLQLSLNAQAIAADNGESYTGFFGFNYWWK